MRQSRIRVAAVALSACALFAFAGSSSALAEGGPADTNAALINPTATTELHITKYAGTPLTPTTTPDGTLQTVTGRDPLAGVVFKVTQVTSVDLTTNQGWVDASSYVGSTTAPAPADLGTPVQQTTDANGVADFTGLAVGLYYVEEVSAPSGYTMSSPFYVTLPMRNPAGTEWMYDVYVYPKNAQDTITLAVTDRGTQLTTAADGTTAPMHAVDYTITSSITDGTDLGMYVVNDNLDPSVDFTGATVTLSNGTPLVRCTEMSPLTPASCDYLVFVGTDGAPLTFQGADATVTGGPTVSIVFTDAGLITLQDNASANVVTTINTTLNSEPTGDGIIPNTASFIPNQDWWTQNQVSGSTYDPTTPDTTPIDTITQGLQSNPVQSQYGDVAVLKYDAVTNATLPGAEFTVYQDADNDNVCTSADAAPASVLQGAIVTNGSGIALFTGLQVSDFYNNADGTADPTVYCLVETKAPAGYNLNPEPIAFQVADAGSSTPLSVQVANQPTNLGNSLPLTGGAGVAAVSGLGALLVGGGLAYYLAGARRRDDNEEQA